ncbi:MAG: c-type cytochrome domain-containing protein [Pirellula sp.]
MNPTHPKTRRMPPNFALELLCALSLLSLAPIHLARAQTPSSPESNPYASEIQPIFTKYCVACHNQSEHESNLKLQTLGNMLSGGDAGPALIPGKPESSLILRRIEGLDEPKMPPEESPQPPPQDIAKIRDWIQKGAPGSDIEPSLIERWKRIASSPQENRTSGNPSHKTKAITATALLSPTQILLGRFARYEWTENPEDLTPKTTKPFVGKISQIRLDRDAKRAAICGGLPGLGGLVHIVDLQSMHNGAEETSYLKAIESHIDILYCAVLHPTEPWVATAGYDRTIRLWNYQTGELLRSFDGHNGAVYDLDFDPSGNVLASASADETVKVWRVDSGQRLDTLGQGEAEQLRVRFLATQIPNSIDIIATGADRRIRQWRLPSLDQPSVSPLLQSIFAHESTIHQLALSNDQHQACTGAHDGTIKIWDTRTWELIADMPTSKSLLTSMGWNADGSAVYWSTLDGELQTHRLTEAIARKKQQTMADLDKSTANSLPATAPTQTEIPTVAESDQGPRSVATPQILTPPVKLTGTLKTQDLAQGGDWYAIDAKQGQRWQFEIFAERDKSPLDSLLEITDQNARPILRTRLQALRESYFTFRGKDSSTIDDFRLHRWEDMQLNEWLYAGGEVVRLWLYPRGPDSGYKVYPGFGNRYTYFGTSPIAHALNEPAWVVRELQPEQAPLSNGLPVFPIYYSNDDDPNRRGGKDSLIEFSAPVDGRYFIRIRDTRGLSGDDFKYTLSISQPNPRFVFRAETNEVTLRPDVGTEFVVSADRFDGLDGDIQIGFEQVPEGVKVVEPLTIEKGQLKAIGQIRPIASELAQIPTEFEITLVAKSLIAGREVVATEQPKIKVKVNQTPTMKLKLVGKDDPDDAPALSSLNIRPGQTISAKLVIERGQLAGDIAFGGDDSGRNLPHGCFVDNIGLNGLLIPSGQSTREVFITAAPIVQPQRRVFHLRGNVDGNPTSLPIELIVQ